MADKYYYNKRLAELKTERSTFLSHYRDLSYWLDPSKGRFLVTDENKGERRFKHIINSRGYQAKRTAVSGMYSGTMSPSRPWFKLEPDDLDLLTFDPVREWLYRTETDMRTIFLNSNLYSAAPQMIDELLLFSTGAMSDQDDPLMFSRFTTHATGSYVIATDEKGMANTFGLERYMTAAQIIEKFGIERVSSSVRSAYDTGAKEKRFVVAQLIEPNPDYEEGALEAERKKFRSVWFEPQGTSNRDGEQVLRRSGFDEFPVYVPRWDLASGDVYGTNGPGMIALGDVRGLIGLEKEKAKGIKRLMQPLLKGPLNLKNADIPTAPDGMILYDNENSREGLSPVFQVDPRISEVRVEIDAIEQRINQAFMVDLFQAVSTMRGIQPRNELELAQRAEEALFILGPNLERFHKDFLQPLITRTFAKMVRANRLPPPPPELEGQTLNIRFVSSLAQAQRSSEVAVMDRFLSTVGAAAQFDPSAVDAVDTDAAVNMYAHLLGVPPQAVRDPEVIRQIREARAQQQAAQQQAQLDQQSAMANAQNAQALRSVVESVDRQ